MLIPGQSGVPSPERPGRPEPSRLDAPARPADADDADGGRPADDPWEGYDLAILTAFHDA